MKRKHKPVLISFALALIAPLTMIGFARGADPGEAGGAMTVEAATSTAMVLVVDHDKRMIKLRRPDGTDATFQVGPEVVNFDKIKVGDQVKATVMKSVAVYAGKPGEAAGPAVQQTIAVAPKGAMPEVRIANTAELTAKIIAIDSHTRMVTLKTPSGQDRTVHVGPHVDLRALHEGDDAVFRFTERLMIRIESGGGSVSEGAGPSGTRNLIVTEGVATDATITALDPKQRMITLKRPDDSEQTFRAGNGVVKFEELQVGNAVKAILIEELAVAIRKADAPAESPEPASVALAPGESSAASMYPVKQESLNIKAIDPEERDVTFQDAEGHSRIIHVGPQVKIEDLKPNDSVVVGITPGVAVSVEKR